MADIFEEVDESLRKDDTAEWWKKYGIFVWMAGLAIVAAVAFREWSSYQTAKVIEEQVELFETARASLAAGDYPEAQRLFEEITNSDSKISPLAAQFLAKAFYEGNGDAARAVQVLEQNRADAGDGPIERISRLKAAYLQTETMNLAELEAYLGDLTSETTAIGAFALELVAAKAFRDGDLEGARTEFSYLTFAPNAPQGVTQRAETALSVLPAPAAPVVTPETPPTPEPETVPEGEETEQ